MGLGSLAHNKAHQDLLWQHMTKANKAMHWLSNNQTTLLEHLAIHYFVFLGKLETRNFCSSA